MTKVRQHIFMPLCEPWFMTVHLKVPHTTHRPTVLIIAGRNKIVITELITIIPAINSPTVTYGVRGASIITENADAKSMAFLIIPLPGLAAVHMRALSRSLSSAYLC